jgi:hypothetical protein
MRTPTATSASTHQHSCVPAAFPTRIRGRSSKRFPLTYRYTPIDGRIYKTETYEVGKVASSVNQGQLTARSSTTTTVNEWDAISQSRELLEWPALSRQVACFCSVAITAERFLESGVPLGATQVRNQLFKGSGLRKSVIIHCKNSRRNQQNWSKYPSISRGQFLSGPVKQFGAIIDLKIKHTASATAFLNSNQPCLLKSGTECRLLLSL